jgi:rhodanese-related sulfurtransferase
VAKHHSVRFVKLVEEAKACVRQCTVLDVKPRLDRADQFYLVDVREESEWNAGHLPKAIHLGKGVIERDIEQVIPDTNAEIILYCGGGYRSALAAENLQKMGYTNVTSMDGGWRGWTAAGFPTTRG